ncbi:hypothetical protein [Vagococcus sp. WN89Y]|uniref:hypothetical protein n=1 Tax=Vagococcus sp. WN89Y TaxID=3457258 RepID=UPI003FCE8F9E
MIPEYLTFIRYQDKKFLVFIYLISFILLGLYWSNTGYAAGLQDVGVISAILTILLFKVIYELKAYWAYKCVVGTVDLSFFAGKKIKRYETVMTHPLVISLLAYAVFFAVYKSIFSLLSPQAALNSLVLTAPLLIFIVFRLMRNSYIKQVATAVVEKVKYKHLYRYVCSNVVLSLVLTLLMISPLRGDEDFSFEDGFFSPRLMIAMWILCATVLIINILFMQFPKHYIFLGRLFLNEVDFYFSTSVPFSRLHAKPQWYKLLMIMMIEAGWIVLMSALMMLLDFNVCFEAWFLCCFLPCLGFYALYLYWNWHNDFMMACDMYLRWGEIKKQSNLW